MVSLFKGEMEAARGRLRRPRSVPFCLLIGLFIIAVPSPTSSVELTFELLDNAKDCFHEFIKMNTSFTLEYQVVTGGSYDVDVMLQDPNRDVLYKQAKSQFDSKNFVAAITGDYTVCFSNEFSTFSHKMVYMDWIVGEEPPLPGLDHPNVMTQMESSAEVVHKSLTTISDYQTHHRLREAQGRKRAEVLNERVFWWSLVETICILTVAIGQVCILRNFFSEKRPYRPLH